VLHWRIWNIVTFLAIEFLAYVALAAFFCNYPRAIDPGRIVPDVLRVAAVEIGYPV
jgi:hypothetical protein